MIQDPLVRSLSSLGTVLIALLCLGLVPSCGKKDHSSPSKDAFLHCRHLVNTGQYQDASNCLRGYARDYPNSKFASRAGLFLGKAELALGNFENARTAWQGVKSRHPNSLEGHKVRYKLAVLNMLEGKRAQAIQQFEAMATTPDGPLAAEAKAMARALRAQELESP